MKVTAKGRKYSSLPRLDQTTVGGDRETVQLIGQRELLFFRLVRLGI